MALRGSDFEHDPLTAELRGAASRRFSPSSLIGALVAVVVVLLGGYGFYRFFLAGSPKPAASVGASTDMALVQRQLDAISKRLDRLEKEQHRNSAELADLSAKQAAKQSAEAAGAAAHPAPIQKVVVVKQVPTPDLALQKQMSSLQNNTDVNAQAWHATANQLADMAGQLGAAQGAIDQNQRALRQLLAGPAHSLVQFQLQRGAKEQRVGPVWMYLKSVDTGRQRYTLEVLVNDRWTELKDRAVNELVEFLVPQFETPLELVATNVGHNTLSGYLAVPTAKASH